SCHELFTNRTVTFTPRSRSMRQNTVNRVGTPQSTATGAYHAGFHDAPNSPIMPAGVPPPPPAIPFPKISPLPGSRPSCRIPACVPRGATRLDGPVPPAVLGDCPSRLSAPACLPDGKSRRAGDERLLRLLARGGHPRGLSGARERRGLRRAVRRDLLL